MQGFSSWWRHPSMTIIEQKLDKQYWQDGQQSDVHRLRSFCVVAIREWLFGTYQTPLYNSSCCPNPLWKIQSPSNYLAFRGSSSSTYVYEPHSITTRSFLANVYKHYCKKNLAVYNAFLRTTSANSQICLLYTSPSPRD